MCYKKIRKEAEFIKECFINLIAISSYPAITMMDYGAFTVKCKILDTETCNQPALDRTFIAANIAKSENPSFEYIGNAMCRYEFFEVIVRCA